MDEEGTPLFQPHVEAWLKAMRSKLAQWSGRLLAQVTDLTFYAYSYFMPSLRSIHRSSFAQLLSQAIEAFYSLFPHVSTLTFWLA